MIVFGKKFNFYPLIPNQGFDFVWFYSLRPIYKRSVMQGRVFLDWTSTKLGLMCLAQGPKRSDTGEAQTRGPSVSIQALYNWTIALPTPRIGGVRANICYHTAACVIPFKLICNMTKFWKKVNFWPFDPNPRVRKGGLRAKYLLPCYCISRFHLIWYATWSCLEKSLIFTLWSQTKDLILFDFILYVPFTSVQLCRDGSSWIEPVLS